MIYRRFVDLPTWRFGSPFGELERLRRQMERLYDGALTPDRSPHAGVFPPINLTEDKDNFYIRAELPGVKGEELDVQVTANNVAISGERKIAAEEGARYHRREREAGTFSRMIGLPGEVNSEKVEASLSNGILTIVVAKAEIAKPKQITVTS
jgi:HSP20 family protein